MLRQPGTLAQSRWALLTSRISLGVLALVGVFVCGLRVAPLTDVLAQAPATVVRLHRRPSQKAMPIIGPTFSQTLRPATTSGNE